MSHRVDFNPLSCQSPIFGYQSPNVWYKPDRSCFSPVCNYSIQLLQIKLITVSSKSNTSSLRGTRLCWKLQKTLGILAETKFRIAKKHGVPDYPYCPFEKIHKLEQVRGLLGIKGKIEHIYVNISKHAGEGIVKVDFRVVASTAVNSADIINALHRR